MILIILQKILILQTKPNFWFHLVPLCEHPSKNLDEAYHLSTFLHSLHLVYLYLSLLLCLSLLLSPVPILFLFSFSTHSCALQSKQLNKFKQEQYGLPHVLFLISPVFKQWFIWHLIHSSWFSNWCKLVMRNPFQK